jgi:hypothetical protein
VYIYKGKKVSKGHIGQVLKQKCKRNNQPTISRCFVNFRCITTLVNGRPDEESN